MKAGDGERKAHCLHARSHAVLIDLTMSSACACGLQGDRAATDKIFVRVFDKFEHFVLDTMIFSPVIYISYEGGPLSPPVVTSRESVNS